MGKYQKFQLNKSPVLRVDRKRSANTIFIKTGETQMTSIVEALVPGGKANPGPPLGPALGPLGVNIKEVVEKINEKTRDYNGMQVPVKVIVDDKKNVEIEVGTPPTASLVMKELGIQKGSGNAGSEVVGNLSISQVAKIARMKKEDVLSYDLKATMKEVMGTCVPMGVTVEGLKAKDCQKELDKGKFDDVLAGEVW